MHTFKFETNDKTLTTFLPISHQHRSCRNITPLTADTPGPGPNFQSQSPGHEAFGGPRAEAAGRKRGLRLPRPGRRLGKLGPGLGVSAYAPKTEKIKYFSSFVRKKKSSSASAAPTGSGFRQSCPPSFQQEKAVSWPSKVNGVFFRIEIQKEKEKKLKFAANDAGWIFGISIPG